MIIQFCYQRVGINISIFNSEYCEQKFPNSFSEWPFCTAGIFTGHRSQVIVLFIDLTRAHDTLPRRLMFRLLSLRLGLPHFVELLRAVYTNTTAVIKGSKKSFKVARGCRQGGLESLWI